MFRIDVKSQEAKALQDAVQQALAERDYSTADDPVMAEYIVVMLANQKTQEQITAELQDLVGPEYQSAFTAWLWEEAERRINGKQPPVARARSRSPPRRRSASPDTERRLATGDSWQPQRADRDRAPPPRQQEESNGRTFWQKRPSRDLFDSAIKATREQRPLAMDAPELRESVRIQGVANGNGAQVSIFGRAGIPDPRAAEFIPSSFSTPAPASSASIFSRIDPMLPNNEAPPEEVSASAAPQDYPTAPAETSLCRWNLKCTNPMCAYSHASPSNAGRGGDENALVLSTEACQFGAACSNKECTRSHVSPAIAFIDCKVAAGITALGGGAGGASAGACRFQDKCTNAACTYAHFDKEGKPMPSPALSRLAVPSESKAEEDTDMDDGETELQTTMPNGMDRALGESIQPNGVNAKRCKFGNACTRADCFFSHPPGRKGAVPCRFGLGCTRADCYYEHPPGRRLGGDAHISDRLQRFANDVEGEMETIIPGQ